MAESVFANIIATFIGGILVVIYQKFIHPFIKEHFTDKIKLKRLWKAEIDFGSGQLHGMKLVLNKLGNDVRGEIEFVSGRHLGKKYPLQGNFHSNILTLIYFPSDPVSTSQGGGTFQRLRDGDLLKGYLTYFSQDINEIKTVECEFYPI